MTDYPEEILGEYDDDGTMVNSLENLKEAVIGHRIVSAERKKWTEKRSYSDYEYPMEAMVLTLDNGKEVRLHEGGDCCAYTEVRGFLLNPELVDHVITGVGTTDGFDTWHIYADLGDVVALNVAWSPGNPFYYGYGFNIEVVDHS
jgi:hypothetical protein